jgi:peptidyl-prolyl cis-trans isomerase SurA
MVDENASPADTLKAFDKILALRSRIMAGEPFEEVAKANSEDKSAAENGGDLGYFTVFRMVYPFENAAYSTNVGEVSKPFKTRFGYHLVKVVEKRENRGEVTVAHIMIAKPDQQRKEWIFQRVPLVPQTASFSRVHKVHGFIYATFQIPISRCQGIFAPGNITIS